MEGGYGGLMNVTPSPCSSHEPCPCILSYLLTFKRVIAEPPLQPHWLRTELLLVQTMCRGNGGPHLNQGMLRVTPAAFIFMFNNL